LEPFEGDEGDGDDELGARVETDEDAGAAEVADDGDAVLAELAEAEADLVADGRRPVPRCH